MVQPIFVPILDTPRLRLRSLQMDDAARLTELLQDPVIHQWTLNLPWPYMIDHARQFIELQQDIPQAPVSYVWGLCKRGSAELIGVIGLHDIVPVHGRANLGYWMGEQYRGHGYTTEATRRVVAWAFEIAGLHRVQADYFPGNDASAMVMKKSGMHSEGILREYVCKNGRYRDVISMSVVRSDTTWKRSVELEGAGV